jgi:biotin carboxyl carrier protein
MAVDIKLNNRKATVELVSQQGNLLEIKVGDTVYKIDIMHTSDGTFSILEDGLSYDIELTSNGHPKKYTAYTLYHTYELEIIDAESQYILNRHPGSFDNDEHTISSPMPGKVVKILVSEGEVIKKGDTAIIISAMKMESEYKSPKDGVIKKIYISEGEPIEGNQLLIELE